MIQELFTPPYALSELLVDSVFLEPRHFNWQTNDKVWDALGAARCDECNTLFWSPPNTYKHREIEPETECSGYVDIDGPMAHQYYPLERILLDPREMVKLLEPLPLCLVKFNDRKPPYALALTATGMDHRWSICEAFMRLKFLPPFAVTQLPVLSGRGYSPREKWIIGGCKLTCEFLLEQGSDRIKTLTEHFPA